MTVEELVRLIQEGRTDLISELWERVYFFIRKQAHRQLAPFPPHMQNLEDNLINSGYFGLMSAVNSYAPDSEASFIHWLSFHLKTPFSEVLDIRTERGKRDPSRYAASLDAPVNSDTEDITLADTIIDPSAEDSYNRVLDEAWRRDMRELLTNAIMWATENKPEARRTHALYR